MANNNISSPGASFVITPPVNGQILEYGGATTVSTGVGVWTFQWVPDLSFQGGLTFLGRIAGIAPQAANVGMTPIPYQAISVNNAAVPYTFSTDPLSAACIVQVPSNSLSVGVLVNCTAGFGTLYAWQVAGPAGVT